ncbi:hypothetical protein P4O66_007303 [Electrophorus voltai]|uniref:Murine leukemia virus integrase C-terminal domain-containing protein n=1 Tax=Electrophorus voltai TaxID=2609070 RepID=A0AAD9DXG4_9TELE|nr:hypothetical protein P4O66_007303 [Electrophorus voltai]
MCGVVHVPITLNVPIILFPFVPVPVPVSVCVPVSVIVLAPVLPPTVLLTLACGGSLWGVPVSVIVLAPVLPPTVLLMLACGGLSDDNWITSPVAHHTRSHATIKPSAEPEAGYAPQFTMVEVLGPEGVIMVHRHWTADDIMKAADSLSKPGDIGRQCFGQELMAFVQSCRPTQAELRRLLMIRLGPQYNRIDRGWVDGDVRLHLPEWNAPPQGQQDLNGPYREMIRGLIERVETAYPTTINTDMIAACKQRDDEPVADFPLRLTCVHTDHCGIDTPAQRAAEPGEVGAWEAHLRNSFLMNMRKDISDLIRKNCIGYSRAPLSTIEEHAKHHDTILGKKDARRERQRADTTHQAMLTMLHTQVKAVLPEVTNTPLHTYQPDDWVLIKDFRRKRWSQLRWRGPFQVLLTTNAAVKTDGRATWVHHTHCKKAPETPPQD